MNIGLIAHDKKKDDMVMLVTSYKNILEQHSLFTTGHTGLRINEETGLAVTRFNSGPYGGDQQIGAMVSKNEIDAIIFLRDALTAQPHEPDISALMRLCDVYNVPLATNLGSAEILLRGISEGFLDWRNLNRGQEK